MKSLFRWWKRRQIRKAAEKHAYWKAMADLEREIAMRTCAIRGRYRHIAAAREAKYAERYESLLREPQ